MPCKKNPGGETHGPGIGKLGKLGQFLSGKMPLPDVGKTDWLELCQIKVTSGRLWIGDPQIPNAEDGCVANVPHGTYLVEGIGCLSDRARTAFSIRARLKDSSAFQVGDKIGDAGTDCAMVGVCDIGAFEAATKDAAEEAWEELEKKTWRAGFGCIKLTSGKGGVMAFVPSGDGDGNGPVFALVEAGRCIGFHHDFFT